VLKFITLSNTVSMSPYTTNSMIYGLYTPASCSLKPKKKIGNGTAQYNAYLNSTACDDFG